MADADMSDGDPMSSEDDLEDMVDIDVSEEDMDAISQLEEELKANPNLYEKHIEYIALLRKNQMKSRLRTARQAMHSVFPLSAELWLDWLDDELAAKADASFMESLFKLAVEDYLSITIWEKYLRWVTAATSDQEKIRNVFEAAITAGGLHLSEGHKLWDLYRSFEEASTTSTGLGKNALQVLYRQIQIPLAGSVEALGGLADAKDGVPEDVKRGQKIAEAMLEARREAEKSVTGSKPADTDLLAAYMSYITMEELSGDIGRVQCLFERTLAKFPVTHHLWQQYTLYLEKHSDDHKLIQRTYMRAVRNCPWVGPLWSRSLRALERAGGSNEAHLDLYNAALSSGLDNPEDYMDISLARLDFLRRAGQQQREELWATFSATDSMMQSYFPDYVDSASRLPSYWASCLLEFNDDHRAAKQVWEGALSTKLSGVVDAILAYVAFEVTSKHYREARSIFRKYHRSKFYGDGNWVLAMAWLRFERERGSAEDLMQAIIKTEPIFADAAAHAYRQADPRLDAESKEAVAKTPKPKLTKEEQKRLRQEKDPNFKATGQDKRPPPQIPPQEAPAGQTTTQAQPHVQPRSKDGRQEERKPEKTSTKRKKQGIGFDGKSESKKPKLESNKPPLQSNFASAGQHDLTADNLPAAEPIVVPSKAEQGGKSAAAVNIDQTFNTSRAGKANADSQIQPQPATRSAMISPPVGTAAAVSTPSTSAANPGAEVQLQNPKQELGPIQTQSQLPQASASGADASASGRANPAALNRFKRQIYVKSIAPVTSEEDISTFLAPCGRILKTAMPLNPKTGKHRGFAYVTFASPDSLAAALAMDSKELHGHSLKINATSPEVPESARTAFVLNLPETAAEHNLGALFQACGPIVSIKIPRDAETSAPKGFAYVEFETREGLQNAVDMTGVELSERLLQIKVSDSQGRGAPSGPGRGGRGGRGGRFAPRGGGGGRYGGGGGGHYGGRQGGGFNRGQPEYEGHEPPNVAGRGGRLRMDLEGPSQQPQTRMPNGANAAKSNDDFRAMFNKR